MAVTTSNRNSSSALSRFGQSPGVHEQSTPFPSLCQFDEASSLHAQLILVLMSRCLKHTGSAHMEDELGLSTIAPVSCWRTLASVSSACSILPGTAAIPRREHGPM